MRGCICSNYSGRLSVRLSWSDEGNDSQVKSVKAEKTPSIRNGGNLIDYLSHEKVSMLASILHSWSHIIRVGMQSDRALDNLFRRTSEREVDTSQDIWLPRAASVALRICKTIKLRHQQPHRQQLSVTKTAEEMGEICLKLVLEWGMRLLIVSQWCGAYRLKSPISRLYLVGLKVPSALWEPRQTLPSCSLKGLSSDPDGSKSPPRG